MGKNIPGPDAALDDYAVAPDYARRLAGPIGVDAFNRQIREQRYTQLGNQFSDTERTWLCSTHALAKLLMPQCSALDNIDIYSQAYLVRLTDMLHKSDRLAVDLVQEQLIRGATIRFRNLEKQIASSQAFAAAVGSVFHGQTTINAYLTPGGQNGFPPHFDNTDVFVIQIIGSKHWTLFEHYSHQMPLPLGDVAWDPERYQPDDSGTSLVMNPGDVLYIPRGGMHTAGCTEDFSLHLTVSLESEPMLDRLQLLMREWANHNLTARQRVPEDRQQKKDMLVHLAADFFNWLQLQGNHDNSVQPEPISQQQIVDKFNGILTSLARTEPKPKG